MSARGHLDASSALAKLVTMLADRCMKDPRVRTLDDITEIDALIWGATKLVEISGSWAREEQLGDRVATAQLRRLARKEGWLNLP